MRTKVLKVTCFGIASLLLTAAVSAGEQRPSSMAGHERAIRSLMFRWIEAYKDLDAKRLAALETPRVQIVDRFGVLHVVSGRSENEHLWSDSFEVVSRKTVPPAVEIDRVQFLRPDVAIVQACWQFPGGILLIDGERVPPFSEIDSYVVIKSHSVWLVAAHNVQEKRP
jgi:uncharacterized protein (TIGR02246 family)